ncbi:MAG: class I fructose-bisphosphate aldolase [Candidatus Woesebacteria bacterium]|nr:class I fructose-bisphosphate aldolase [Candidatus Woesebacteria bacterium]
MNETVYKLLVPYKGILAADSTGGIKKRFEAVGLTFTPELDVKYKEMIFTTPSLEQFISGVILNDTNIRQRVFNNNGIVMGIKVDEGLEPFNNTEEQITKGFDSLSKRLDEYKLLGAEFTKWRAVIKISDIFPTDIFLDETLSKMAKYAKLVQSKDMIPIVEPEVLLDGNHTTTRCAEITEKTLKKLFELLLLEGVDLTKVILKTNMVLPGKDSNVIAMPLEVAGATLRALNASVPKEVPGIVFLSGGQSADDATNNLNEIVKTKGDSPWDISFSFERALQVEVMKEWAGKDLPAQAGENIPRAHEAFLERLTKVSKARMGEL